MAAALAAGVVATFAGSRGHAQPAGPVRDGARLLYSTADLRVRIYSEVDLPPGVAKLTAESVVAAWAWLLATQQWPDTRRLDVPLNVKVIDRPGFLGAAGPGYFKFALGSRVLLEQPQLVRGTIAHELCHVQDRLQVGDGTQPGFISEGRGLTNGFAYRKSLGFAPQPYDRAMARSISGYSPADVREVVSRLARGNLPDPNANRRLEFIGAWFVEYLRTTHDGHGYADVQPRLARIITALYGGRSFADAFAGVFSTPFPTVQAAFVKFAADNRSADRLKRMMWDGLLE